MTERFPALALLAVALSLPAQSVAQEAIASSLVALPVGANTTDSAAPFYIDLTGLNLKTKPPTRDPNNPNYPRATELSDGRLPTKAQSGNFIIGPSHPPAPEVIRRPGIPKGRIWTLTISSADGVIYTPGVVRAQKTENPDFEPAHIGRGDPSNLIIASSQPASWTRSVKTYVPAQQVRRNSAPFMIVSDGDWAFDQGQQLFTVLDNLIAEKRMPPVVAILIDAGGQDAQGSERGREYDTVSGTYAQWVDAEILPRVERQIGIRLTRDPNARATVGLSSSGSAAFTMAWFRPDLYRRVLAYSPTFVNQQWPHDPALPGGAWEYHSSWPGPTRQNLVARGFDILTPSDAPVGSPLIQNTPHKPIRFWFEVGDRDMFYPLALMADGMHDWVLANENMAKALASGHYQYQFLFARNADHVGESTVAQTLPAALEWVWYGYPRPIE